MAEEILDYILSDPKLSFEEVMKIIDFHKDTFSVQERETIVDDLKHAFN